MDENLHKDDLERFFKKAFDDLEQEKNAPSEEGDWDVPSNKVWDDIAPVINESSTILSLSWIKIASIAASVALLLCTVFLFRQNDFLSDQLVEKNDQLKQLQQELNEQKNHSENTNIEKNSLLNTTRLNENNPPTAALIPDNNSTKAAFKNETKNTTKTNEELIIKKTPDVKKEDIINPSIDLATAITAIDSTDSEHTSFDKLGEILVDTTSLKYPNKMVDRLVLELKPLTGKERDLDVYVDLTDIIKAPKPKLSPSTYARVFMSHYYTGKSTKVKGSFLPPGPFRNIDDPDLSVEYGFRVGKQLNERWKIETGASFFSINHKTNLPLRINFDRNLEIPNPINSEEQQSVYSLTIPTAYGDTALEVELNRQNDQINPPDRINTKLKSKRKLNFTSIPVFVAYKLKEGKINAYLKGGIAVNQLNNPDLISDIEAVTDGFRANLRNVNKDFAQLKKTSVDYVLGMELGYQLSQRVSLNVEPTYRRNVKPIFETALFSTKSYAMGLQAGVNVHF